VLGFILSKMQMLLFATGILVVALMMYGFISNVELKNVSAGTLDVSAQIIEEQVNTESLCSFKKISIPEVLRYGLNGSNRLFYDLKFAKEEVGASNLLILAIAEHKKDTIVDSRSVALDAEIVLVDPGFIAENEPLDSYYDKQMVTLYPRSSASGILAAPNAFVALKEVKLGNTIIYIIPCSSRKNEIPNNCIANVLRTGCYLLGETTPEDNDEIEDCFDISRDVLDVAERKHPLNWENCKDLYGLS
jgi:hypothetical protein